MSIKYRINAYLLARHGAWGRRVRRHGGHDAAGLAAQAGSVTQPGETIGYAPGAPLPQGWYFADTTDYGQRTPPSNASAIVTIPVIVWATPYHFLGAQDAGAGGNAAGGRRYAGVLHGRLV